jgi:hypothetical protein
MPPKKRQTQKSIARQQSNDATDLVTTTTGEVTETSKLRPLQHQLQHLKNLLSRCTEAKTIISKSIVDEIGLQLGSLADWKSDNINATDQTDAEVILSMIGSLLERDIEENSTSASPIAGSKSFCNSVLLITQQYCNSKGSAPIEKLFESHYCYELALYLVLSLVEKTSIASMFVNNVSIPDLENFLFSLISTLPLDKFYLTQVNFNPLF